MGTLSEEWCMCGGQGEGILPQDIIMKLARKLCTFELYMSIT